MRRAALFIVPALLGTAALAATQSASSNSKAEVAAPTEAAAVPTAAAGAAAQAHYAYGINQAIADWRRLRQSDRYSFADYARFLIYNPEWPGETAMRRDAEQAMRSGENPATVLAFFATEKPLTGRGHLRHAEALLASGRQAEAIAAAREAWASDDLDAADETAAYSRFGSQFSYLDHERRADALLFDKKASDAYRLLGLVSAARRPVFEARIAMQTRTPDADRRYQAVAHRVSTDAGLLMDRARYLRDGNNAQAARQIAARPHALTNRPADVGRFYEMLLILASGAASDGQWTTAYNIARQVDDALPPGTDLSTQPYDVRDNYTSLTWLAGTTALDVLGNPTDAIAMFHRYANGGRSLQVTTKGQYWAGRAALAAKRIGDANAYFSRAALYPELYYGQLALERLGRSVPPPNPLPTFAVTQAQRAAFGTRRLVQATRQMAYHGNATERYQFVRALAESLDNDAERVMAIELAGQIGRPDLPVWVARSARNSGSAFYVQPAFPKLTTSVPSGRLWALTHGITRQESSFDAHAVSHAGARGMMQLMPGTAREQAGKMGYGYDFGRLTGDPNYNVMLGSAYFQRMLSRWDGNVPLAVASYNAGAGNVAKWVRAHGDPRGGTDVLRWIERIPFQETKGYVQRVIENTVVYDQLNPRSPTRTAVHVSSYLGKSAPG